MFLSEIRSLIEGMTNLNEMVDVICARYHFTEDTAKEYILACADEIYRLENDESDNIARNAASLWCRCYKCDGIINETGSKCEKPKCTCNKWFDAYKGALIALK